MTFDWRAIALVVLLILATLVGVNAYLTAKDRAEWEETAERFEREAEAASDSVEFYRQAAEEATETADSAREAAEEAREEAEERISQAERAEEAAERATDSLMTAFEVTIGDSLPRDSVVSAARRVFRSQQRRIAALQAQITSKDDIIAEQDGLITHLEGQIQAKDALIDRIGERAELYRSQRNEWRERAKPGIFELNTGDIVRDVGLALVGYGLGKAL